MMLDDNDVEIHYDELVSAWYLEAFGVKQYLSVHVPLHEYGAWQYVKNKKKDFLDAGKRAREILNRRLLEMGIVK